MNLGTYLGLVECVGMRYWGLGAGTSEGFGAMGASTLSDEVSLVWGKFFTIWIGSQSEMSFVKNPGCDEAIWTSQYMNVCIIGLRTNLQEQHKRHNIVSRAFFRLVLRAFLDDNPIIDNDCSKGPPLSRATLPINSRPGKDGPISNRRALKNKIFCVSRLCSNSASIQNP